MLWPKWSNMVGHTTLCTSGTRTGLPDTDWTVRVQCGKAGRYMMQYMYHVTSRIMIHYNTYDAMTDQVVKFVSKVKISCPKLQNHIECAWVITFWFSCIWQVEPTILWCFAWLNNREKDYAKKFNTYFGDFFQSPQRTSQYCNIQNNHNLVVNDSPRTIFQSSFTCSFDWYVSFWKQ